MSLHVYRFAFSHSITSVLFIYGMTMNTCRTFWTFLYIELIFWKIVVHIRKFFLFEERRTEARQQTSIEARLRFGDVLSATPSARTPGSRECRGHHFSLGVVSAKNCWNRFNWEQCLPINSRHNHFKLRILDTLSNIEVIYAS